MRKLFSLSVLFLFLGFTIPGNQLNKKERKAAISYFKETEKNLVSEISGLTENQLNWKPADSIWSIAECVEHIALSEKKIFDWAMSTLKTNADPSKRSALKFDDEGVKKLVTDRSFRVKTREGFIPSGQFGSAEQTLAVFKERRAALIKYMKETKDDLRNHYADSPLGLLDSYQVLLFLSGHTQRHTLQIIELKSYPGFPKV